jgi:bleomycin hydrolase
MKSFMIFMLILCIVGIYAQEDTSVYKPSKNEFYRNIETSIQNFYQKPAKVNYAFKVNVEGKDLPRDMSKYTKVWANPTLSQGNSGTCWCFCTTSFYESEIYRLSGKKVKLSEMYTVYWETVEKVRRFVRERGNSLVAEGSQSGALKRIWKQYGIVPAEAYDGKLVKVPFHYHEAMYDEIKAYLASVKANHFWNEQRVIETVRCMLDEHMGRVPETIVVDGQTMTPQEYLKSLPINLDEYMELISLNIFPYYQFTEYPVEDNWNHETVYFNVPLNDFMTVMKTSLRKGFSIDLGGDVTEAGHIPYEKVAIVPTFDIPSKYINEEARAFRFCNQTTTDDHGIHCIGYYAAPDGFDWFLIKDSGSGVRNVEPKGYYFMHEDYIKLKMMNILVHKDAAPEVWAKYQEAKNK